MRFIKTKAVLKVEKAIEVQGLHVDAVAGLWNRGDRTIASHKAVFKVDGLSALRSKYPNLAIVCEVYDDTSAHIYTIEVAFVSDWA